MERKYEVIIFDLDDTLSDDTENRKYGFAKVLQARKEEYTQRKFLRFIEMDNAYWSASTNRFGEAPKECITIEEKVRWIRSQRFLLYFKEISLQEAMELNDIYMDALKEKVIPIKGAKEILLYIKEKRYLIGIATNGPTEALMAKLEKLAMVSYIDFAFSADEVGFLKPHTKFYEGLKQKIGESANKKILFVGDDNAKDIRGGNQNDMDTCWFNPHRQEGKYIPTYEITQLDQLKEVL